MNLMNSQGYGNPMMSQPMTQMNPGYMQNRFNNFTAPNIQTPAPQMSNMGITWVQGIEGAKAYQLMPNSNAMMLDSDNDGVFYIKVSDNVGMCTLRTFNYIETTGQNTKAQPQQVDMSMYVTRQELQQILGGMTDGKQTLSTDEPTTAAPAAKSK